MANIKDVKEKIICDKCGHKFPTNKVLLKSASKNCIIVLGMLGVDKNGIIVGRSQFKDGDQTLHCPKCGELHLFGFDIA